MSPKVRATTLFCCLIALSSAAQAQLVPDAVQNVVERQAQQAQERAVERAQEQAREQAQNQATEQVTERSGGRAQEQAAARAQQQASERAQEQAAESVLEQTVDRVQGQAESAQSQALDRVRGGQSARVQEQLLERALPAAAQSGLQTAQQASQQAQQRVQQQTLDRIAGPSPMAALPDRLPIVSGQGGEVFVEIAIEPNIRALEREWVMLLNETQRAQLIDQAPELMLYLAQTSTLAALDSYVLRFRVPPDLDANDQVLDLVPEALRELIDRNHVYSAQSAASQHNPEAGEGEVDTGRPLPVPMSAVCEDPVSVGVIDSLINTGHTAFARPANAAPAFVSRQFLQENVDMTSGHGTAVAGVLVGDGRQHGSDLAPLLPNATIYSASVVYAQDPYHQGATVLHLLEAISWMLEQDGLRVINMSLTGPANRLLEQAVRAVQAQDKLIVAAAGNNGPHASVLYPAAYDGVIAVTAVADDRTVYRWAAQGEHVDFAALGVSVPTARGSGSFGRESGTSMATPVVSAFFACELASGRSGVSDASNRLINRATDLGTPGRDPVFGHGLLHASGNF